MEHINLERIKYQNLGSLKSYILNKGKKPLLIHGPPGTGKTSSVYALANELDYELIEINASDCRNKSSIESVIGSSIKQASLFKKGKIILVDEIEGIAGNEDRGGIKAILDLAEESSYPIIATTTEIEEVEDIKSKFILLEFKKLPVDELTTILEGICNENKIEYLIDDLRMLARISGGDARLAMINLNLVTLDKKVQSNLLQYLVPILSDNTDEALLKLFKSKQLSIVLNSLNQFDHDLVDSFRMSVRPVIYDNENCFIYSVEENLPYEYNELALSKAFDLLSKADLFHGRISRRQHYRYLVYIQHLIAAICLAKESKNIKTNVYKKTSRSPKNNKKLWWLVNRKKTSIAGKIADHAKMSSRKALKDFGYYKIILSNSPISSLTDEEIDYLNS